MKYLITLLLPFTLLLIGCDDDDTPVEEPGYEARQESAFGCANAESWQLDEADFQINEMIKFGDYFLFGGFDDLLIMDEDLETVILEQELGGREFLPYNNKLIICGDGLHEFTTDGVFTTLLPGNEVFCQDVVIGPGGELLVADGSSFSRSVMEFVDGQLVPYSDQAPVELACSGLYDLAVNTNGTVWASTCSDKILKFNERTFEAAFNTEEEPLLPNRSATLFLLPYQDGVVMVAKNGIGFYKIWKYAAGQWVELIDLALSDIDDTPKESFMARPSLVDAFIKDDLLYVATSAAGCEGIQRFDITKNEALTEEDYDAFEDPFYRNQCITAFTLEENGDVYVVVTNNQMILVDCP